MLDKIVGIPVLLDGKKDIENVVGWVSINVQWLKSSKYYKFLKEVKGNFILTPVIRDRVIKYFTLTIKNNKSNSLFGLINENITEILEDEIPKEKSKNNNGERIHERKNKRNY